MMVYQFIIVPEPDACNRCKTMAFINGTGGESRIHEADDSVVEVYLSPTSGLLKFGDQDRLQGATGMLHENCRCIAKCFQAINADGEIVYQSAERRSGGGEVNPQTPIDEQTENSDIVQNEYFDNTGPSRGNARYNTGQDAVVRNRFTMDGPYFRYYPGLPFTTLISNTLASLVNSAYKLAPNRGNNRE